MDIPLAVVMTNPNPNHPPKRKYRPIHPIHHENPKSRPKGRLWKVPPSPCCACAVNREPQERCKKHTRPPRTKWPTCQTSRRITRIHDWRVSNIYSDKLLIVMAKLVSKYTSPMDPTNPGFWRATHLKNTLDGKNPAPPEMHETLQIMGYVLYQLVSWISSINRIPQVQMGSSSPHPPGGQQRYLKQPPSWWFQPVY